MKKKGFTLIELLAVIVVLAVISFITIPMITGVIKKSRVGAFKASVLNASNEIELYLLSQNMKDIPEEGILVENMPLKNNSLNGKFIKNESKEIVAYYISDGNYCAYGPLNNLKINKNCSELDAINPTVDVKIEGSNLTITMTDNYNLGGYAIHTSKETEPTYTEISGRNKVIKQATEEGIFYVWVRDTAGNVAISEPVSIMNMEDNWKVWATKANLNYTDYTDISALLADTTAVNALLNSEEAVAYMMESKDTNTCIRKNVLDTTAAAILALKNANVKSKILADTEWKQMILDRTSLIDGIISNNLHTTISTSKSTKTYDVNAPHTSLTSNFTLNGNDLVLKGTAYLSFNQGGGSYRSIYLNINGVNVAANSGTEYLLPYNGSNIQATAYNKNVKVTSAYVSGSALPSFNASAVSYCEIIVSGTLYVLR